MRNAKLLETIAVSADIAIQDLVTARTGAYHDAGLYSKFVGLGYTEVALTGSVLTVQLMQAKDSGGTQAKELGTAVTATSGSPDEALSAKQEADASDLDIANGFTHVAVRVSVVDATSPDGTVNGGGTLIKGGGRFNA